MKLTELIEKYQTYRKQIKALEYANYVISWDSETEAPIGSIETRSIQVGALSEMLYKLERCDDYIKTVQTIYANVQDLDEVLQVEIKKVYKNLNNSMKIPVDELVAYSILLAKAQNIWAQAKINNDYQSFKTTLLEIINFNKKIIKYLETDTLKGYDVLLDQYEEKMTQSAYDQFFSLLKAEIVPLVKKINEVKQEIPDFAVKHYDIEKQKEFAKYLMKVMCFDEKRGLMKESEHPFTSGSGTTDVRVTNHYYEDLFTSSIFSTIHELGHATYEQQCNPKLDETLVGGGTSMAMHESQSRFYENIVGRSYEFWLKHYPVLQNLFKENLENVTVDDFYQYINQVRCSLIRTEADELTYPLHIMIRYEMEKEIFNADVDIDTLPQKWNQLYKEYLGIDVPSDKEGILQDVHWAGGSFGYFPTYALGSAYGAQLLNTMKKDIDIKQAFGAYDLKQINEWLKNKIHYYGALKTPEELLIEATKEKFNPKYYIEYLKNKFSKIYSL